MPVLQLQAADGFMASQRQRERYEPCSRFWHSAAALEGLLYLRGGNTSNFMSEDSKELLADTLERFDPVSDTWQRLKTSGPVHPGLSAVACASYGGSLFAYGGFDAERLHGTLSQLDLRSLVWKQLSPEDAENGPMRKDASGMIHFGANKLVVIAGYAQRTSPLQSGSTFVPNEKFSDGTGWTNELHVFDICEGSWFSPEIKGCRPPPCADFTLTSIDIHRAVLYGGCRPPEGKRLDKDLYIINFTTMETIRIEWKPGELWPVVTVGHHAACCLGFNTEHPQLLVSGGRTSRDKCLRDIWKFDLMDKQWEKIELPVNTQLPRWGHSATTVTLPDGTEEVVLVGGTSVDYQYSWDKLGSKSLLRLLDVTTIFFGSSVQAVRTSGQLSILRRNIDLAQYVVEGAFTGRQLGSGYFGTVEEITVKGLLCAGKKIKSSIISTENYTGGWDVTKMYLKECRVMASFQHPNITQFIGLCLHPSSQLPIIVMERLKGQLHDVLETCPNIPMVLKRSLLKDVSSGLAYLHPQVIHRDVTAKNVLVTPFFVAKICDFGSCLTNDLNAKIQRGLTPYPGAREYMPPEALAEPPLYDSSVDIFSFGHVILFTMIQEFPDVLEENYPSEVDKSKCLTEVERRRKYFDKINHKTQYHELIKLSKDCLQNSASDRPTAEQIVNRLERMKGINSDIGELLDAIKQIAVTYEKHQTF